MKKQFFFTCLPWLVLNPFVLEQVATPELCAALDAIQS
jgi:hypothetical protein